jgi:cation transport protein ChaC
MTKKVTQSRKLLLTPELVSVVERTELDPGPEPGTNEHTDEEFSFMVEALLKEYSPADLWVFAYGSLIWNPEFKFEESRPAQAKGWHRSFCLTLTRRRGTREYPALMMALDRGGSCKGVPTAARCASTSAHDRAWSTDWVCGGAS